MLDHLDAVESDRKHSLDALLEAIAVRTRQFARRQRMWFRRDPRISWLGAPENPVTVLPALLASWGT